MACRRFELALRPAGALAQALGRSPATISWELWRNGLASGVYRPAIAEGSYLLRLQRPAVLERDHAPAGYVTDRLISQRFFRTLQTKDEIGDEQRRRERCAQQRRQVDDHEFLSRTDVVELADPGGLR